MSFGVSSFGSGAFADEKGGRALNWPTSLPFPLLDTDKAKQGSDSVGTLFDSGRTRMRRMSLIGQEEISVQWNFTEDQYNVFLEFFTLGIKNGSLPFVLDGKVVAFKTGQYTWGHEDNVFSVAAVLVHDDGLAASLLSAMGGGDVGASIKELQATLVGSTTLTATLVSLMNYIPFKFFDGPVYAVLPVGDFVYVSGRFTKYGKDTEGWVNCAGLVKILRTGEIDPTFAPGGVVGGGFRISGGYFAPTQLQAAADGGVFCGSSYAFLPEPRLYLDRSESSQFDSMELNGVVVPPLIKLLPTGDYDDTFVTDYLQGAATTPKFMSFHMAELSGLCFTSYTSDIVCTSPNGYISYTGADRPTLDSRGFNGVLRRRAFRNRQIHLSDVDYFHQVFLDQDTGNVYWSGMAEEAVTGGLVITESDDPAVANGWEWKMSDFWFRFGPGIITFYPSLDLHEPADWAGYDWADNLAGNKTNFFPQALTRGCFRGSMLATASGIVGEPFSTPEEGRWRGSFPCQHKGAIHFNFDHSFVDCTIWQGTGGSTSFSIDEDKGGFMLSEYNEASLSNLGWFYKYHDPTDEVTIATTAAAETTIAVDLAGAAGVTIPGDFAADWYVPVLPSTLRWEICTPYMKPTDGPWDLWDLRGVAAADDTPNHGFDPFSGAVLDYDGCSNIRGLCAQYDGTIQIGDGSTDLSTFFTGMIEKFKGDIIFDKPGQLMKVKWNGDFVPTFSTPVFGPDTFPLLENITSGASETHHNKINCAVISPGGKVLYVGGKFTELDAGESTVQTVGHIVCIDITTGEARI